MRLRLTGTLLGVSMALLCGATTLTPTDAIAQQVIKAGDVLSGELRAMRSGSRRKRVITYQIKSAARKLPGDDGLCNLETGPETFQLITNGADDAKRLKSFIGKTIAVKVNAVACSRTRGELSDAVVSNWSLATKP